MPEGTPILDANSLEYIFAQVRYVLASISAIVVTQKLFDPVEAALKTYFQTFRVHVTLPVSIGKCFLYTSVWWREFAT